MQGLVVSARVWECSCERKYGMGGGAGEGEVGGKYRVYIPVPVL